MDINFSQQELDFRNEVKDYLENKYPKHIKEKQANGEQLSRDDVVDWHKSLFNQGWAGYNWPVEYGGTGWSPAQIYIFQEELGNANCPNIIPFGLNMVGPVIYTFGNDEQKKKFLPDILEFNSWWCQGYSEPGSGSDLASLKTKAVKEGNEYVVNGAKTWTTLAQFADWIFCLVRTETTQKKQEGISFLLIDMKSPGIEVKPIITIDGEHEVNSVFFTDVKVPCENLIGEEGKGWTYAKFLLGHERFGIAGIPAQKHSLNQLKERTLSFADDDLKKKIAEYEIELSALEFTELRSFPESISLGSVSSQFIRQFSSSSISHAAAISQIFGVASNAAIVWPKATLVIFKLDTPSNLIFPGKDFSGLICKTLMDLLQREMQSLFFCKRDSGLSGLLFSQTPSPLMATILFFRAGISSKAVSG